MSMLKVACEDQRLYLVESMTIASGGVNETRVSFNFCPLWDGFIKTAVFYQNMREPYYAKVNDDNTALIPWEATQNPGFMYFGVFGIKDGVNRTSEVLTVRIVPGAITAEIAPEDPTPDIYIQILSDYNTIIKQMVAVDQRTAASAAAAKQSETNASAAETNVSNMENNVEALVNGFDTHVGEKKTEISELTEACTTEIGNLKDGCKTEINNLSESRKTEINTTAETRKNEIDEFTEECKTELDNYVHESGVATITDVRKAAPRNLLDNSDFGNPVNQRGQTSYNGGYSIDRWCVESGTLSIANDCVNFTTGCYYQICDDETAQRLMGKTLTVAIMDNDGNIRVASGIVSLNVYSPAQYGDDFAFGLEFFDKSKQMLRLIVSSGHTASIKWVAVYEGEYTAETLPEYQPKGYGAELAECMRYYYKSSASNRVRNPFSNEMEAFNFGVTYQFPMPMRVVPTCTISFDINDGADEFAPPQWVSNTGCSLPAKGIPGQGYIDCHYIEASADL